MFSIFLYIMICIFFVFVLLFCGMDNIVCVLELEMYSLWVWGLDCCDSEVDGRFIEGVWFMIWECFMEVKKLVRDVWWDILLGDLDGVVDFEVFNLGGLIGEWMILFYFFFFVKGF